MADYSKIYEFMTEYTSFLKDAEEKEKEKLSALLSNDVKRVESVMSEYQFIIKKMQSFEERRQILFLDENIKDMNIKEIPSLFEGEQKTALEKLCMEFVFSVDNIKQYNSKSLEIADMNLRIMDELNSVSDNISDPNCYNQRGIQNGNARKSSLFNTQI